MKCQIWMLLAIFCLAIAHAQSNYWEFKQGELESMISQSDLIITGELVMHQQKSGMHTIRVVEVLRGPQRLKTIWLPQSTVPIKPANPKSMDPKLHYLTTDFTYIFFLKRQKDNYIPLPGQSVLKQDIFLLSRIKKEVMKWRIDAVDHVVVATVEALQETPRNGSGIQVLAKCKKINSFKGEIPQEFIVQYYRTPQYLSSSCGAVQEPQLHLFSSAP